MTTTSSGPEKVKRLGIDHKGYRFVMYARGQVTGVKDGKRSVLASPAILEEPEYRYFIDADGDLSRQPQGAPWSPPAVVAKGLPLQALKPYSEDSVLASIRFARMPFEPITYYESELLEPEKALSAWEAARAHASAAGLSAVIRTFRIQDHVVDDWIQTIAGGAREREKAGSFDAPEFFKAREAALSKTVADGAEEGERRADELAIQKETLDKLSADELTRRTPHPFHYQTLGQYVVLVLVSCEPWELPVCLGFGGWNEAPDPVAQSGVLRRWSIAYGADLVAAGGDFLEMRTTRTLSPSELKTLAWEHFLFADDVVFQGARTVDKLAREISTGRWFFWWD